MELLTYARSVDATWIAAELATWAWRADGADPDLDGFPEPYPMLIRGDWAGSAGAFAQLGMPYEKALPLMTRDDHAQIEAPEIMDGLGAVPVAANLRTALRRTRRHPRPSRSVGGHSFASGRTDATPGRGGRSPRRGALQSRDRRPGVRICTCRPPRICHLARIGVSSRAEAFRSALDLGIVQPA